jgi:hypothetical protein
LISALGRIVLMHPAATRAIGPDFSSGVIKPGYLAETTK